MKAVGQREPGSKAFGLPAPGSALTRFMSQLQTTPALINCYSIFAARLITELGSEPGYYRASDVVRLAIPSLAVEI